MQFHNPEVLFALFLLIIPVIVHLFQLRKFRKENFTNVKFLRRVTRQTRKSSRLKKLLVLTTRLLLLSCIIFAFSRPYFPEENEISGALETVIYLDNSYSMQAEGQRGNLLERSKQELLEHFPENHNITLITNSEEYREVTSQDIQEVEFSPLPVDLNTIFLKAGSNFSGDRTAQKQFLFISDFKEGFQIPSGMTDSSVETYILPLRPQNFNNVSIDSAYFTGQAPGTGNLTVILKYTGQDPGNIPVSLYDGSLLLGKSSVEFSETSQKIEFPISEMEIVDGRLQIEDNGLQFDNTLYF
ncbi:MAG TPA: BatA domain-containing protein, partial [Gillisia sp.]|nr:BatA domain-containing protein [Gillisia sp.]